MSAREMVEWEAYDSLIGLPDRRQEWYLAQVVAAIAEVFRDSEKRSTPFKPEDFIRSLDPVVQRVQTVEESIAAIAALNEILGGSDARGQEVRT